MIKKVGNWFFRHGMRVIGTGSFQSLDVASLSALEGLTATVTSLVALAVASLSALQGLTVAAVGSMGGFNAASLSSLRNLSVGQVASVANLAVSSTAGQATVQAGSLYALVANTLVKSNSAIFAVQITDVASDNLVNVSVGSLVEGTGFAVNINAAFTAATTVSWGFLK